MEGRMTVCNMSIEAGARAGHDRAGRNHVRLPGGPSPRADGSSCGKQALEDWRTLGTDEGAEFDKTVAIDASTLRPHVTWGTNPGQVVPIDGIVPDPVELRRRGERGRRQRGPCSTWA